MKIYIHKVRMNLENGWGQSLGMTVQVLGHYKDMQSAIAAKEKRDQDRNEKSHDCSKSWIDEEILMGME